MHPAAVLRPIGIVASAMLAAAAAAAPGRGAVPPAAPAEVGEIVLAFDVDRACAGCTAVLRAELRDAAGRPVDAPLQVEVDAGTVEPAVRVAPGIYTARITAPAVLRSRREVLVFAAATRQSASVALPVGPGPATSIRVDAVREVAADGEAHPVWIAASDAHGNAAPETPVVKAERGAVDRPAPFAGGGWVVQYRPSRDAFRGEDRIDVTVGPAQTSARIRLAPMPPGLSVAARGGVVFGTGRASAVLGADVATWMGLGDQQLGLVIGAAWWTNAQEAIVQAPAVVPVALRRTWLPVTASAAFRRGLGPVAVTLSAGGGMARVSSRAAVADGPAVQESGWAPVAEAGTAIALRAPGGEAFVEGRVGWLGDPRLDTLRGTARLAAAYLGYRVHAF